MAVGEEAVCAEAVRIVPDDEIGEPHLAVHAHPTDQAHQVATAGFILILQAAEDDEIA